MKPSKFFIFLMTLGAWLPGAKAGTVPFPNDGDLFMGFHSPGATNEYLWNIGQYTKFDGKPVGFKFVLGNIGTDLTTVFGASWATNTNVKWGSAGTFDATAQLFATKAEPMVGVFALPWQRHSVSSQTFTGSQIDTMVFGDYAGQRATPNNRTAVIHDTTGLSWTSYQDGPNSPGASFQTWVPTIEAPTILPSDGGIVNTRLDLFRIDPDNTGTDPDADYIGTLSIDTLGNVLFEVLNSQPPSITQQPRNASVTVGEKAKFQVVATGAPPLSYQWRKNGVNIAGATAAKYKTPPTTLADDGARFSVVVTNNLGSATSQDARLSVKSATVAENSARRQ